MRGGTVQKNELVEAVERLEQKFDAVLGAFTRLSEGAAGAPLVFTVEAAAKRLSLSRSALKRLVLTGQLVPVQLLKRRIGFTEAELQRFVVTLMEPKQKPSPRPKPRAPIQTATGRRHSVAAESAKLLAARLARRKKR